MAAVRLSARRHIDLKTDKAVIRYTMATATIIYLFGNPGAAAPREYLYDLPQSDPFSSPQPSANNYYFSGPFTFEHNPIGEGPYIWPKATELKDHITNFTYDSGPITLLSSTEIRSRHESEPAAEEPDDDSDGEQPIL